MIALAKVKFVRISPRKVRYVIDRIRSKSVAEAQGILNGSPRRASDILRKLLNQAVDAAEKNSKIGFESLFVSKVMADGGPAMKRFRAASMGRGVTIKKRTSHITLELDLLKKAVNTGLATKTARPKVATKHISEGEAAKKTTTKKSSKKLAGAK